MASHAGATEAPNNYIKRLLKNYLASADRSLSGPDRAAKKAKAAAASGDNKPTEPSPMSLPKSGESSQQTFVLRRLPVFLVKDRSASSCRKTETVVRGKPVACFDVGGEKRLCVPDLLNTVLRDVTIDEINAACDQLCVHCSQCSSEQIAALKNAGVLPPGTASAGLMTKSQAERLCRYLFEQKYGAGPSTGGVGYRGERLGNGPSSAFKVYHECFGKCKGILYADRYTQSDAACIECCQCQCLMSPADFVCHSHKSLELRTCHWGFDATKWRAYLLVAREHSYDIEPLQARLEELKDKFKDKEPPALVLHNATAATPIKRKELSDLAEGEGREKRQRLDDVIIRASAASAARGDRDVERHNHHLQRLASADDVKSSSSATRIGWISQMQSTTEAPKKLNSVGALLARRLSQDLTSDRRQLAEWLHHASRDNLPVTSRQQLSENILQLFDQRNQVIVCLLQVSIIIFITMQFHVNVAHVRHCIVCGFVRISFWYGLCL